MKVRDLVLVTALAAAAFAIAFVGARMTRSDPPAAAATKTSQGLKSLVTGHPAVARLASAPALPAKLAVVAAVGHVQTVRSSHSYVAPTPARTPAAPAQQVQKSCGVSC